MKDNLLTFMICDPGASCNAHRDWLIFMRSFSAVLKCLPSFFALSAVTGRSSLLLCSAIYLCLPVLLNVQFRGGRSTCHFCSAVLMYFPASTMLTVTGRFTCHLCSAALLSSPVFFFALFTVTGSSKCHLCSTAFSGRKSATVACPRSLRLFRGLRSPWSNFRNCQSSRRGQMRLIGPRRVKSWRTGFTRLRLS